MTSCEKSAVFRPYSNDSHYRAFKDDGKIGFFSSVRHLGPELRNPRAERKFWLSTSCMTLSKILPLWYLIFPIYKVGATIPLSEEGFKSSVQCQIWRRLA